MNLKKLHLPPIGVIALLAGGFLRVLAFIFEWPLGLVIIANVTLFIAVAWILMFDLFPIFLQPFYIIRHKFSRRKSFFIGLIAFFAFMQIVTVFLPSGPTKDATTLLAFTSFMSAIVWFMLSYVIGTFTPLVKYMKRTPRVAEKVTFSDVITSMAIIITPTIALSFFISPPGLGETAITPYTVFITSLLTDLAIIFYLYLFILKPKVFTLRQLGIRKVDREDVGRALVLFIFVSVLVVILQAVVSRFGFPLYQYSFSNKDGALFAYVVAVLLTPFVEELYFRGFLFKGLMLHNPPWVAFLTSSILFALLHPPVLVMIEVFIIGLLLAYVVRQTKSIWPGVLVHALNNAIVFGYLLFN